MKDGVGGSLVKCGVCWVGLVWVAFFYSTINPFERDLIIENDTFYYSLSLFATE